MSDLEAYLRPMTVAGPALSFDLSAFRSTVTRQMLQVRLRLTARAFAVGSELVAANVTSRQDALEVEAEGLEGANSAARSRLDAGPEGALTYLRQLATSRLSLDRVASAFGARFSNGRHPSRESFVAYIEASGRYQALGALKFCLPDTLRPMLAAGLAEPAMIEALLAPEDPSLWSVLRDRELVLAGIRLRGPAGEYRRRLIRHRHSFGYLFGEDVDFQAHESLEAIDARLGALGAGGMGTLKEERRLWSEAMAADRAAKLRARTLFADWLASRKEGDDVATLVSHVLLTRALAFHEDLNRRAKMRFLRDLRDRAQVSGLDLGQASLAAFAAGCPARRTRARGKAAVPDRALFGTHARC